MKNSLTDFMADHHSAGSRLSRLARDLIWGISWALGIAAFLAFVAWAAIRQSEVAELERLGGFGRLVLAYALSGVCAGLVLGSLRSLLDSWRGVFIVGTILAFVIYLVAWGVVFPGLYWPRAVIAAVPASAITGGLGALGIRFMLKAMF